LKRTHLESSQSRGIGPDLNLIFPFGLTNPRQSASNLFSFCTPREKLVESINVRANGKKIHIELFLQWMMTVIKQ
jgi:hypothetical protein